MKSRIEPKSFFWGQSNPGLAPWAVLTRAFSPKSKPVSMVTAFGWTLTKTYVFSRMQYQYHEACDSRPCGVVLEAQVEGLGMPPPPIFKSWTP